MNGDACSPAEWRWIELKGYMSSVDDLPQWGVRKGWMCMNCHSMVYYDKCPNDQCYNFYGYINGKRDKFMQAKLWEMLDELGITGNEKETTPHQSTSS